jgi:hypothetical protein
MSAKNLNEENKMLVERNHGIMRELDKVTNQLHEAQDSAKELDEKLQERKHSEQLAGWAIDRALETAKLSPRHMTAKEVIEEAATYCAWIISSSIQPKKQIIETPTQGNA